MQESQVDVLVVGAGPAGVTMANLLGVYGIKTLLVERNPDILDYPRAVGLDDEAMRTFQAAGLAHELLKDMIQHVPLRMYTAKKQCFAEILPTTQEFGWCRRNLFSQPLGEQAMRQGLSRFPHVQFQSEVELVSIEQDSHQVRATLKNLRSGDSFMVQAQYLIGADGGRSTVRETLLNIPFEGKTHARKWVVIECDNDPLDAPYTALHCEPRRPYVCLRLPYGLRRWEFMLFPGEDGDQMLHPDKVRELLSQHVADPSRLNVIRARVYTHNSRVARDFVQGRVCLAGDAAHITPPWIGQGLNAGLRDVFNLTWKIAWILKGRLKAQALSSYQLERHSHAKAMIELADLFGAVLSQTHPVLAWVRDKFFMAIRGIPSVRDYVLQMKFKPMPRFTQGVVLAHPNSRLDERVGRMFIQPKVELERGVIKPLDDVLGSGFALLTWQDDGARHVSPAVLRRLDQLGCTVVAATRSKSLQGMQLRAAARVGVTLVEDFENALHVWFSRSGADWVLIRPDRYVATLGQAAELDDRLALFASTFLPDTAG